MRQLVISASNPGPNSIKSITWCYGILALVNKRKRYLLFKKILRSTKGTFCYDGSQQNNRRYLTRFDLKCKIMETGHHMDHSNPKIRNTAMAKNLTGFSVLHYENKEGMHQSGSIIHALPRDLNCITSQNTYMQ